MLFEKTKLWEVLEREKAKDKAKKGNLLKEVGKILDRLDRHHERIASNLSHTGHSIINPFHFDILDTKRIYHIDQIKKVCIDYRLRFLDSKYFKGNMPNEALAAIRQLEVDHDMEIKGFKIMAPSKLFKLEDKDDPLLFAPIGNDYYYLVHTWGNDLHPLRKLMMWPFKNVANFTFLLFIASFFATLLIPSGLFSKSDSVAEFGILFFFTFKSVVAVAIFYGFALGKNFSPAIWNSKYYNA